MDNSLNSPCYAVRDAILNNFKRFVDLVEVEEANDPLVDIKAVNLRRIDDASKKTNKRLKNLVEDIKVCIYCTSFVHRNVISLRCS